MDHLNSKVCLRPAFILSKLVCCARRITHKSDHTLLSDRVVPALPLVHQETLHSSRSAPPRARTVHITVSVMSQDKVALDIARMLLAPPASSKSKTFILHCSAGRHVLTTGQRGPLYAVSITQKLRKLTTPALEPPFPSHSRRNPAFRSPCSKASPATTTLTTHRHRSRVQDPAFRFLCLPTCLTARANSISCLVLDPGRLPRCCWRDIPATQRPRARAWGTTRIPPWRAMSPRLATRALPQMCARWRRRWDHCT